MIATMARREAMMERSAAAPADPLWVRYRKHGDVAARQALFERHVGLVHLTAYRFLRKGARGLDLAELVSAGMLGLLQALEGFDLGRGLAFSTYAMPRIRGAMLDEMNRLQWAPRPVRLRRRLIRDAQASLQQRLGRRPTDHETARALGLDDRTFWRWAGEIQGCVLLALDSPGSEAGAPRLLDAVSDASLEPPGDRVAREQALEELRAALQEMAERDRTVLTLYYYEGLTLREIGEALRISESRVSQIHGRALARMRARVSR